MALTINGVTHADGQPLTIDGVQASEVTVNGVSVWKDSIIIAIPQQSAQLDLTAFIADNNPSGATNIVLTNAFIQPTMNTGALTGLTVRFEVDAEIQGFASGSHGLIVEAPITLINSSVISSGGGNGGVGAAGAKGADDSYDEDEIESLYVNTAGGGCGDGQYHWRNRPSDDRLDVSWAVCPTYYQPTGGGTELGPVTVNGVPNIYRGSLVANIGGADFHRCDRHYTQTYTRVGGAGGAGGAGGTGAHWSNVAATPGAGGAAGLPSEPSGGNSGGTGNTGGSGGALGVDGAVGGGGGAAGTPAGTGLLGSAFLTPESVIGTIVGGTA